MADTIEDAILENATGPAQAAVDGQSATQHRLAEQIEADRYLKSKEAAASRRPGVRFMQFTPPGMT